MPWKSAWKKVSDMEAFTLFFGIVDVHECPHHVKWTTLMRLYSRMSSSAGVIFHFSFANTQTLKPRVFDIGQFKARRHKCPLTKSEFQNENAIECRSAITLLLQSL